MRRHVIALSVALILGSWPQESTGGQTVTLKIEVSLPDGVVFYIPSVGDGEMPGIVPLLQGPLCRYSYNTPDADGFSSD